MDSGPPELSPPTGAPAIPAAKGKGAAPRKAKKPQRDSPAASSSSSTQGGVRLRRRRGPSVRTGVSAGAGDDNVTVQDLGLPLGMSFAAVLSKVLEGKNASQEKMHVDWLSQICTSAVKECLQNIYGERFDHFVRNFEKSFGSTLMTLRSINEASVGEQASEISEGQGNSNCSSATVDDLRASAFSCAVELQENLQVNSLNNQLILHGGINQLSCVSNDLSGPQFNHSMLSTIEKSVVEQSRSNDLKAVEIGLMMRKIEMKQSQLALSSYSNYLDKIKICMGFSKASFKEEKLRNQMQDMRKAELLKTCNDLLLSGTFIMLFFLACGIYVYSFERVMTATSSCISIPEVQQPKGWSKYIWPYNSFSFISSTLKCQVQVFSRMSIGLVVILVIVYFLFQRSAAISGPTMPVTVLIMLLGAVCGFAGKFSVDIFGGSGYCWLLYWEALCLIHFVSNVFPSVVHYFIYGPVSVSKERPRARIVPYWMRRYSFYCILVLILPALCGLLPFASLYDWKDKLTENLIFLKVAKAISDLIL